MAVNETKNKQDRSRRITQPRIGVRWADFIRNAASGKSRFRRLSLYTIICAFLMFIALIYDGLSREKSEFSATVIEIKGKVHLVTTDDISSDISVGALLHLSDTIVTGPLSSAIITMHDGSAIQLEPNTSLQIRMLDYTRNNVREHTFLLKDGGIIALVSRFFGIESQQRTSCPTAVAAARGTSYYMNYKSTTAATTLQTILHKVQFSSTKYNENCGQGMQLLLKNGELIGPTPVPPQAVYTIENKYQTLTRYERGPGLLETIEQRLVSFINPLLQVLGNGPDGLSDSERILMCRIALNRIGSLIEQADNFGPLISLNHITLSELRTDEATRFAILSAFDGGMLEGYNLVPDGSFTVFALARDSLHTRIIHTGKLISSASRNISRPNIKQKPTDSSKDPLSSFSENVSGRILNEDIAPVLKDLVAIELVRGSKLAGHIVEQMPGLAALVDMGAESIIQDIDEIIEVKGASEEIQGPDSSNPLLLNALASPMLNLPAGIQSATQSSLLNIALADNVLQSPGSFGFASAALSSLSQNLGPALLTALVVTDKNTRQDGESVVPEASTMAASVCGIIVFAGFAIKHRRY